MMTDELNPWKTVFRKDDLMTTQAGRKVLDSLIEPMESQQCGVQLPHDMEDRQTQPEAAPTAQGRQRRTRGLPCELQAMAEIHRVMEDLDAELHGMVVDWFNSKYQGGCS